MPLDNTIGIVDVVEFEVQRFGTRDLLFSVDYATRVSLAVDGESLDIRGGIGAPIRISLDHSRTANFGSELPLVDVRALGVKLGRATVRGATTAPRSQRILAVTSTIAIAQTPLAGTLRVYLLDVNGRDVQNELIVGTPATTATHYSIAGLNITVHTSLVGRLIKVVYDYTSGINAQLVRVTSRDFAGFVRVTGTGYALDESGNRTPISFIVHKCKPTPEFEMIFQNGEATNVPFNAIIHPTAVGGVDVFFDIIPLGDEVFV